MVKKYELSEEVNIDYINAPLYRIRALRDIPRYNVKAGDLGGLIESENNLSQEGDAWVAYDAMVFDDATVKDDAYIGGRAMVFEHAIIKKESYISGCARINGHALISGNVNIGGMAIVRGYAEIYDNVSMKGWAIACDHVVITGDTHIFGCGSVSGYALVPQGSYNTKVLTIFMDPYNITAIYPNHVQMGCKLFKICSKKEAIATMIRYNIPDKHHEPIWKAVQLCKQWLKDNPEPKEES